MCAIHHANSFRHAMLCVFLDVCEGLLSKADPETIDAIEGPVIRAGKGKRINPFRFLSLGIMAYLGNDRAGKLYLDSIFR